MILRHPKGLSGVSHMCIHIENMTWQRGTTNRGNLVKIVALALFVVRRVPKWWEIAIASLAGGPTCSQYIWPSSRSLAVTGIGGVKVQCMSTMRMCSKTGVSCAEATTAVKLGAPKGLVFDPYRLEPIAANLHTILVTCNRC